MQIVRAPQFDQIRPWLVVISLRAHPLILVVAGKDKMVSELPADEPLMIVRGRVDQVTEDLFPTPLVTGAPGTVVRGDLLQTTRRVVDRLPEVIEKLLITSALSHA